MSKSAQELINLIRDIVSAEVDKQDSAIVCIVESVNENGSLNIFLPPDRTTVIRNIVNSSKYEFASGELGILYKIQNSLSNAFVMAKVAPSQVDNIQSLLARIENLERNEVSGGGSSGGISVINTGAGLTGGPITASGNISMGTPSEIGEESINEAIGNSHTHALSQDLKDKINTGAVQQFEEGPLEEEHSSSWNFPNIGKENILYIDKSTNSAYRFDTTNNIYKSVGRSKEDILDIVLDNITVIDGNPKKNKGGI